MGNSIKKVKYEAQYHYYNQKLKRKKRQYKKKYKTSYKSKSIKKKYFDQYPMKHNAVNVRFFRNGVEVFDTVPRYSYIYKGVPGGWY